MELLDILLLILIVAAAITGYITGIVRRLGSAIGLVCGIVACRIFGPTVAAGAERLVPSYPSVMHALAYVAIFLLAYLLLRGAASIIHRAVHSISLGWLDRLGGAVFTVFLWLFLASLVLNVYLAAKPEARPSTCPKSKPWRGIVADIAPTVLGKLAEGNLPSIDDVIHKSDEKR